MMAPFPYFGGYRWVECGNCWGAGVMLEVNDDGEVEETQEVCGDCNGKKGWWEPNTLQIRRGEYGR